ncbi:MAG: hypothetical protein V4754_22190, partial [Pseudomonadota bacterium]
KTPCEREPCGVFLRPRFTLASYVADSAQRARCNTWRSPVRTLSNTQLPATTNKRNCSGLSKSRPLSGMPRASRGLAFSITNKLSRNSTSSANRTDGTPSMRATTCCNSCRAASFGALSTAGWSVPETGAPAAQAAMTGNHAAGQ